MKILMIDKFYFIKGGAERYYFELKDVLEARGHQVIPFSMKHPSNFPTEYEPFFVDNINYDMSSWMKKLAAFPKITGRMIYSVHAMKQIELLIKKEQPDLAHLHMIDHQLSPSILHSLKRYNIPVIQTVHQYKLVCPNYRLHNPGTNKICEKCLGGNFFHPIFERCHKDSALAGALVGLESFLHRKMKIYEKNVDIFHVPSHFMGQKLREGGVGNGKIRHLFYTLKLDNYPAHFEFKDYIVYFGRLAKEKGVTTLLKAMKRLPEVKLRVIGEGPERAALQRYVEENSLKNVRFEGMKGGAELRSLVQNSRFVVVPSEWYDNSPLVIYESFAYGKPVIGARMGGIPELIDHDRNGLHFEAGNVGELTDQISYLSNRPDLISEFGQQARRKAENEFEPETHYDRIYKWYEELVTASSPLTIEHL